MICPFEQFTFPQVNRFPRNFGVNRFNVICSYDFRGIRRRCIARGNWPFIEYVDRGVSVLAIQGVYMSL
jgi:hypothetical protein